MIYFDNAATGGFKPDCVKEAVMASLSVCANAGRSGHRLSVACLQQIYACRRALCHFFGGYSYDRVIFTKNCTEALNIALFGLLRAGDKVVTTVAEHNSVLRPLHTLQQRGVTVKYAPLNADGVVDMPAMCEMIDGNTRAVVLSLASNVTGAAPDLMRLRQAMPAGALFICDGAQACGHVSIDMKKQGIDVLAVAGHKGMMAMQGSGALLFSERVNPAPVLYGGTGSESNNLDMPEFYPDRLESGTLNYPAIASLAASVLYLQTRFHEHKDYLLHLTNALVEGLAQMPSVRLYSESNPYGIVAFSLADMQSEEAAYRLSEDYNICVRGGLHCAPLMHRALDSDGLVRASLSPFNQLSEVQTFLSAVQALTNF